jgi:HEAT repeat protein
MMEMVLQPTRFCLLLSITFILARFPLDPGRVRAGQADQEIVDLVIGELTSGDPERQTGAISIVRDMPGGGVTQALVAELPKLSPPIQVQLLSTLADRGDAAALPAVVVAGGHDDESVRIAALKAVGELGDASSVLWLAQRAAATRGAEQSAAREGLYRLRGAETDATVLKATSSATNDVKIELVRAIGERNITQGVETALAAAGDENGRVRLESLRALKVVAGPDELPALVSLLLSLTSASDRTEAEKTIAAVAHKIRDKDRRASVVLAALAPVTDASDRASLLRVLGRIGDNGALPVLNDALDSQEVQVKDAAIRALAEWPTPEPSDELLDMAQTSDSPVHRVLALRGFVRLLAQRSDLSARQAVDFYKKAMDLAPNAAEKKRVLSGLSSAKSLAAMEMAAGYLNDPALNLEAESAVVHLARGIYDSYPQPALDMLERIVKGTTNDTIRQQAQAAITQIAAGESNEPAGAEAQ